MNFSLLKTKSSFQSLFEGKNFYIVAYHNILERLDEDFLFDFNNVSCDKKSFEEQLIFYKEHFNVIHYSALNTVLHQKQNKKPILIITFDDGYRSFYEIAAPLLKKYNLPATIFLPTDYISTDKLFWWDDVIFLCNTLSCKEFYERVFSVYFFPDSKLQYALNNGDSSFKLAILKYLKEFSTEETARFFRFIHQSFPERYAGHEESFCKVRAMTWDQIIELSGKGFEFGSHTLSHCLLEQCSIEKVKRELFVSKRLIEDRIKQRVVSFCFPAGRGANQEIQRLLKEAGYENACLMQYGDNSITRSLNINPYRHKRLAITSDMSVFNIKYLTSMARFQLGKIKGKNAIKSSLVTARKIGIAASLTPGTICLKPKAIKHIFVAICDHYEPYWHYATHKQAYWRVRKWVDNVPGIFDKYKDSDGRHPVYSFFYPIEEYKFGLLNMLQTLQKAKYGEVEIHLHHDGDTSETLTRCLNDFKQKLANDHGMLSRRSDNQLAYAFIHGNWALDNSRLDGRWCGVNNEITVLQETGCYADLTMPSAPSDCQTRRKNSIYYAIDDPLMPMSHNTGESAVAGVAKRDGLLMIQGPLALRFNKCTVKIENGEITYENYVTKERINSWVKQGISVDGKPDWVFIKLHAHGTQDATMERLFEQGGFDSMFSMIEEKAAECHAKLHYVSARQMANVIHAIEDGATKWAVDLLDSHYKLDC